MKIGTTYKTDGDLEKKWIDYPHLPRKGDIIIIDGVEYEVKYLIYDTNLDEYTVIAEN